MQLSGFTRRHIAVRLASLAAGDAVAKAEADGHTLLLMSNGTAVSAGLFESLPFDTQRDFAPVSTLATFDIAILTVADARFKTLGELVAFARANPASSTSDPSTSAAHRTWSRNCSSPWQASTCRSCPSTAHQPS